MDDSHCEPIFPQVDRQAAYIWFQVKKTQVEMIRDRGIPIPEEEHFLISFEDFFEERSPQGIHRQKIYNEWEKKIVLEFIDVYTSIATEKEINFNSALSKVYLDPRTGVNTTVVYLCRERDSSSITTHEFTTKFYHYHNNYYVEDGLNMIFISEVTLNRKEGKVKELNYVHPQFFLTEELVLNPTQHIFYYPHHLLTEEEREEELAQNGIRPEDLSIIFKRDPIVKYFDWPKGGIVRITRSERYLEMPVREVPYWRIIV